MKNLIAALIATLLPVCGISVEKGATDVQFHPSRLTICLTVKQVSSDAQNNPVIELAYEEDGDVDGLLVAFVTPTESKVFPPEASGPREIERFVEFRASSGAQPKIARLIACHFGAAEIDLFTGQGWAAAMPFPPEKLPGSGGNFWLHEGTYPAKGYRNPVIRLGFNGVFTKGSNTVTLTIWQRG